MTKTNVARPKHVREPETLTMRVVASLGRHRVDLAIVVALFALAVVTIAYFRREPVYSDDLGYWERWPRRDQSSGMANPYRMTMALSAEVSRWVFGHSMIAYNAVGVLYGAGLVAMIYILVRLLYPRPAALGGSLLLLTSTVFIEDASLLMPDWPAMFWFSSAFTLLAYAATRLQKDPRKAWMLAAVAGAFVHFGLFARESAILLVLVVPIGMLILTSVRHAIRLTTAAGAAAIFFFLAELVWFWRLFDDPLRRIDRILGGHVARRTSERLGGRVEPAAERAGSAAEEFTRTTLADWWELAERYVDPISSTLSGAWTLWLIVIALAVVIVARDRKAWFIATAAIIGVIGSVFLVGSINPLRPMLSMKYRYLALGWTFLMPMISVAIWLVGNRIGLWLGRRRSTDAKRPQRLARTVASLLMIAALGVPVTVGVIDNLRLPIFVNNGADGLRQTSRAIDELQDEGTPIARIVTDGRTQQGLRIQLDDSYGPLIDNATSNFASTRPDDLVVLNRRRIGQLTTSGRGETLPEELLMPPANWRSLGGARHRDVAIYYVRDDETRLAPSLSTTGIVLNDLLRATHDGGDDAEFAVQFGSGGLFAWMQDIDNVFVATVGWNLAEPREDVIDAERLYVDQRGRLGARIELHVGSNVRVTSAWLRTYDDAGNQLQDIRLFLSDQDQRVSTPQFAVDPDEVEPMSFAGSTFVDPELDRTYSVIFVARGSGVLTVDRVSATILPTD